MTVLSGRLLPLAATALSALAAVPAASAAGPEQELADRYAPIVALKEQDGPCGSDTLNGEPWRPTTVEIVLGKPEVTLRAPGPVKEAPTAADLYGRGEGYFLDFPGNPLNPGCTYANDGERFAEGQPSVAYAHIMTEPALPGRLVLEHWFYYYFNDFNNKHESDWEGIQLVFDVGTVEEALRSEPVEVGYASTRAASGPPGTTRSSRRSATTPSSTRPPARTRATTRTGSGSGERPPRASAATIRAAPRARSSSPRSSCRRNPRRPRSPTRGSPTTASGARRRRLRTTVRPGRTRRTAGRSRSRGRRSSVRPASRSRPGGRWGRA